MVNSLLGAGLLISFVLYVYLLSRSVYFGWVSLLLVQFYEYAFGISAINVGINLDPIDGVSLALLAAGVMRTLPRLREQNTARLIGLGYISILAYNLVRGSITNGFVTSANEARGFVPILVSVLYFMTASIDTQSARKLIRVYVYYGLGLVVVAFLAYAGLHVGGVAWLHGTTDLADTVDERLLPSGAAVAIAFCFFFSLSWAKHRESTKLFRWLPVLFLGTAVFLRHRTVWNVLIAGILSLLFTDRRLFRRVLPMAAISVLVVIALASVASVTARPGAEDTAAEAQRAFADSATNQGTWVWRVNVWASVLGAYDQTVPMVLFGREFGGGNVQLNPEFGTWVNFPTHSEYVADYLRVGAVGVLVLLIYIFRSLIKLWILSSAGVLAVEPSTSAWVAVLIGAVVYGITYAIPADGYALIGIVASFVANKESGSRVADAEAALAPSAA